MSWSSGERNLFSFSAPKLYLFCVCMLSPRCFICSLGFQGVYWGRRLVVMDVNWHEYPELYNKKKRGKILDQNELF